MSLATLILGFVLTASPGATLPTNVSFSARDGLPVEAHLYSAGPHAAILAHGGVFNKESWTAQAEALVEADLTVLALDFRGYGDGEPEYGLPGKPNDVLGALDFLVAQGHERISVVGGSMGASAALAASAQTDLIDRLVLLAPGAKGFAADLKARSTLFIASEGDRLRAEFDFEYAAAPEPKRREILPGKAHAQHIFATDQADKATALIVDFLTAD